MLILFAHGCVATVQSIPASFPEEGTIAFGRIHIMLAGPTTRWYEPDVRFIELYNQTIGTRIRLDVEAAESLFAFALPEGDYQITRVQIREGGFRGMANLTMSFHIDSDHVNYLGTWTFVVAPPYYDRDLVMTVSSEMVQTLAEANVTYQNIESRPMTTNLPQPSTIKTRLFEMTPYPRVRWFQRRPTG